MRFYVCTFYKLIRARWKILTFTRCRVSIFSRTIPNQVYKLLKYTTSNRNREFLKSKNNGGDYYFRNQLCYIRNIFIPWLAVNESFEVIKLYIVQRVALKFYSKVAIRRFDVKHVQTENLKLSSIFNEVFYLYSRFSYILSFLPWIGMQWRSKWYYYTRLDFVSGVCSIITTSRKRISPPAYNLYYWSEYFSPRGKNYKLRKSLWSYRFFSNYNIFN